MRIEALQVEGFGALSGLRVDDLAAGLVVFSGPNEAGKSTLLGFVTTMLFGFPSRRPAATRWEPAGSARFGGRLVLALEGEPGTTPPPRWEIERIGPPRPSVQIRRPDGLEAGEDELRHLLGGADEALFKAVFAIDLTELSSTDSLGRDSVRELLFSASILGQRRSASKAMSSLQNRRLVLARPRQADARANTLLATLDQIRRELNAATAAAARYPELQAEVTGFEREVTRVDAELTATDRRLREIERLQRLASVRDDRRAAEHVLATTPAPDLLEDWFGLHATTLRALRSECSGHLERVARMAELGQSRSGLEQKLEIELASLGERFDRDRIASSTGWLVYADRARALRSALAEGTSRLRVAEQLCGDAELSAELEAGGPVATESDVARPVAGTRDADGRPLGVEELDARRAALTELSRNLLEQRELSTEVRALALATGTRRAGSRPLWWLVAGGATLLAAGALLAAVLSARDPAARIVCATLAVVALVLAGVAVVELRRASDTASNPARPAPSSGEPGSSGPRRASLPGEEAAALERLGRRAEELRRSLDLGELATAGEVDAASQLASDQRSLAVEERAHARRHAEAVRRAAQLGETASNAARSLEEQMSEFAAFKASLELDPVLSPDGVLECLATLESARSHLDALHRVERDIAERRPEIDRFASALATLLGSLPAGERPSPASADPTGVLDALVERLEATAEAARSRASVRRRIDGATADLTRTLGTGPDSERLRRELEEDDPASVEEEHALLEERRASLITGREGLVRRHQDASRAVDDLLGSAEIAELEQRRSQSERELEQVVGEWTQLSLARALLGRTLTRHERERQPEVLARAGEHFARVTEGRYVRLVPSVTDDGPNQAIKVVAASGGELDATKLSRGTLEQLYLCLRIGLAETFAGRAARLPIVLDDVLVNFDPERSRAVVEMLVQLAARHQVLLFTCHPHLVETIVRLAPATPVIELERR